MTDHLTRRLHGQETACDPAACFSEPSLLLLPSVPHLSGGHSLSLWLQPLVSLSFWLGTFILRQAWHSNIHPRMQPLRSTPEHLRSLTCWCLSLQSYRVSPSWVPQGLAEDWCLVDCAWELGNGMLQLPLLWPCPPHPHPQQAVAAASWVYSVQAGCPGVWSTGVPFSS